MDRVPIQGETLAWARRVSGLSEADLARSVGVKPAHVHAFEDGSAKPTFKQLVKIGKKLDRTPAFFFTAPPSAPDIPETIDFRQSEDLNGLDPATAKALRRAERYREIMLRYSTPAPAAVRLPNPFGQGNEDEAAYAMRALLHLDVFFVSGGATKDAGFQFWREALENHGILIFQTSEVERGIFRGLSVHHETLPIILINGKDSTAGKTFTLLHEVGHLINRASGLCTLDENASEEALVNSFAAHFLMPDVATVELLGKLGDNDDPIGAVAHHFKVSRVAAAIRLKNLGIASEANVQAEKAKSDNAWKRERERLKQKEGGPPHWRTRYRDLGAAYVATIAEALDEERISILDASYYLDSRIPTVDKILDLHRRNEAS